MHLAILFNTDRCITKRYIFQDINPRIYIPDMPLIDMGGICHIHCKGWALCIGNSRRTDSTINFWEEICQCRPWFLQCLCEVLYCDCYLVLVLLVVMGCHFDTNGNEFKSPCRRRTFYWEFRNLNCLCEIKSAH